MTSARRSKAFKTSCEHIDLERKLWQIPLSKRGKGRHIPLAAKVISFLAEAKQLAERSQAAKDNSFVLYNLMTGRVFTNIFNSWDKARGRGGLKDVRMNDLRNSFASALVNNELSLDDVKELLGSRRHYVNNRYI
jgi:integrase